MGKKEMKKTARVCGSRCLGPMKFLSGLEGNARFFTSTDTSSRTDRLVFLCRPIKVKEKVRIRIERGLFSEDGHRAIRIGFTNNSPRVAAQDRRRCVVPLPEEFCLPGAELEFWMNYACFVIIQTSDQMKYYMKAEGITLHQPLFVFLDFWGSTSTVRLLGSRKGSRTSCSVLPSGPSDVKGTKEQALEENLLNLSLMSDGNANLDQRVFGEAHHTPSQGHAYPPVSTQRSGPSTDTHRQTAVNTGSKRRLRSSMEETDVTSLLRAFQQQYLSSNGVHVIVRRKRLLESALDALSNRNFSWTEKPYVEFVGEEAFDIGGPRREFFRLLMLEVQSSLGIFEGNPKHLFFTYDQIALQQRKYEQAGKLVAWSIVHGGPGLKALDTHLYQLMCGVEVELTDFDWCLIPDPDVQRKARKILSCTTVEHLRALQRELGDWICDCGFPGIYRPNICIRDVPKIYSYIVRHHIYLRVSNMINQFTEGLNSCGKLWDVVKANWVDFQPIFTKSSERLSRSSFRALFEISWSDEGTKERKEEEETIYYWELVLKMIEDKDTELSYEELLVFITATDELPVLGFPEKLSIHFYQPERRGLRLPYASTCMMGLFIPRRVRSQEELNKMLLRAVRGSSGFGKA